MFNRVLHTSLPLPSRLHQIDALQLLRAVAVILVCWGHASLMLDATKPPFLDFGIFGVDIFFVISGFILSTVVLRERNPPGLRTMRAFIGRRILRIFPIYWLFSALVALRMAHAHTMPYPLPQYLPSLLLLPSPFYRQQMFFFSFGWTLIFEMFFYYVLAAILLFTVRWAVPVLIAALLTLVIAGSFFDIARPVYAILFNPIQLEFLFGAAIALIYARWHTLRALGIICTLTGVILALLLASHPMPDISNSPHMLLANVGAFKRVFTWGISAALIVGGTVLWSPSLASPPGHLMVILGTASYSAYIVSSLTLEFATRALDHLFGQASTSAWITGYQSLITIAIMVVGWATYNFIEWPMLRKLQTFFLSKPA